MSNESVGTRDWLVAELSSSFLMDRHYLDPLVSEFVLEDPFGDATALADFLVRKNVLSQFQADRAKDGEAKSLVMGPYLLAYPVGAGSLGTVYRAVGKADGQSYAVKVLPLRSLWNVRLARRQVRSFAELPPHPAIVPFVDVGTASGKHYLVWPWVEGESLEALVSRHGPLPWQQAARVALKLAEGLLICHERSIFHGLIKPSNVLVDANATVRLLDFGIGAMLAENTDESLLDTMSTTNATTGMLDCASPESILDPAKRSLAGDQYSLGCVLYYCLAGRYPFPNGNMIDKMMAHQTQMPPPVRTFNPEITPELEGVVFRLLQKSPEARFRHIGELIQDLHPITEGTRSGLRGRLTPVDTPSAQVMDDTAPTTRPVMSMPGSQVPRPKSVELKPKSAERRAESGAPSAAVDLAPPQKPDVSLSALGFKRSAVPPSPPAVTAPPALPAAPAATKPSVLGRFLGKLAFWRPTRDVVACSILAPPVLYAGETATLPLFAHAETADAVLALGRTYFPTHEMVGSAVMNREVPRGARLTFQITLPGLSLEPPVQKIAWRGQVMPLPFTIQVPADFEPGEITGAASVRDGGDTILTFEFRVTIDRQ